jgi:hypothetical protein
MMEILRSYQRASHRAIAYLIVVCALAALLNSCAKADATPAPPVNLTVSNAGEAVFLNAQVAVPDTLPYRLRWGRGARATAYRLTVTANVAGWTGLPSNREVADTNFAFTAISPAVDWNETVFTASVASQQGTKLSAARTVSWKVTKGPGVPGPIIVDSSLIVIGLELKPDSVRILVRDTAVFCAFVEFHSGQIANRSIAHPQCTTEYNKLPLFVRNVSAKQMASADSVCVQWSATGGTIGSEPCGGVGLDARSQRVRFNVTITQNGTHAKPSRVERIADGA